MTMTMSIARLSAEAGVKFLPKTTAHGDMSIRDLTDYYTKSGNSPGVWLGAGLESINLHSHRCGQRNGAHREPAGPIRPQKGSAGLKACHFRVVGPKMGKQKSL